MNNKWKNAPKKITFHSGCPNDIARGRDPFGQRQKIPVSHKFPTESLWLMEFQSFYTYSSHFVQIRLVKQLKMDTLQMRKTSDLVKVNFFFGAYENDHAIRTCVLSYTDHLCTIEHK